MVDPYVELFPSFDFCKHRFPVAVERESDSVGERTFAWDRLSVTQRRGSVFGDQCYRRRGPEAQFGAIT